MTVTTSPTAPVPDIDERITAFAAAVRAELADLSSDEADDLTDGLEADLAEQAADSGEEFALPEPAAYAAELRAAAGLPERTAAAAARPQLRERWAAWRSRTAAAVRSSRGGAWVLDTLLALRPVWWVLRGWVIFTLVSPMFAPLTGYADFYGMPSSFGGWLLLIALMILSVQWGRGFWSRAPWLRVVRAIVNTVTAIALPFLLVLALNYAANRVVYTEEPASWHPGLVSDGERVRNIFAYDAEGNPLTGVQLFDQDGRPLTTVGDRQDPDAPWDQFFFGGHGPMPVPWTAPGRAPLWNVFPLDEVPAGTYVEDPFSASSRATGPTPPFARVSPVPSLSEPSPTPTPVPTDGAATDGAAGTDPALPAPTDSEPQP